MSELDSNGLKMKNVEASSCTEKDDNFETESKVSQMEGVESVEKRESNSQKILASSLSSFTVSNSNLHLPINGFANNMNMENKLLQQLTLKKVKENAQQLRSNFMDQIDSQLADFVDDFVSEVEGQLQMPSLYTKFNTIQDSMHKKNKRSDKNDCLPEKQFVSRDSLLTELLQINHIQTIYNIFVALLLTLFLNTLLCDFVDTGKLNLDFEMMKYAFGKSQAVLTVWVLMKISLILLVFPLFHYWAHNRWHFTYKRIVDYIFLTLYIIYLVGLMSFPVSVIIKDEIPPASAVIIMCEQVRLVMKTHAFVRENVPRAKNYKPHQDGEKEDNTPCPDFGKFLYFLFVPTLVYRDNYPRTPCIRWRFVAMNFLQVLACLFYVYYIFERFCVPAFQRFGHERVTPREFLLAVFGCMMPGTLLLFISFFAVLHLWMNAFAEMMRFGDRMFYKDWWNSTSFANYYRTWNVVVHDWLYTYVYKDMHQVMGIKSMAPMFTVFLLSAVIHEYIVTFSFKFFYPVLFVQFGGFGVIFVFLTNKRKAQSWNIFMWLALFVGTGLLMCLYSMEWYARRNCPPVLDSFFDYMIPRSWMCSAFTLK